MSVFVSDIDTTISVEFSFIEMLIYINTTGWTLTRASKQRKSPVG